MAELNLTRTQRKVDQLCNALWKATPDQVGAFIQRHKLTDFEVDCIRLTYRAMHATGAAIEQVFEAWKGLTLPDEATEREMEVHLLTDAAIEAVCCSV